MTTTATALFNLHIETGVAPAGSVVEEWDWNEDDDGYRWKSFYTLVPSNVVKAGTNWKLTAISAERIMAVLGVAAVASKNVVLRVTVQTEDGRSFMATSWHEASLILAIVQDFLGLS